MIKAISELTDELVGGKAKGLKTLKDQGFNVPEAFVLIHPEVNELDDNLIQKHLASLGAGPKAVRSSAVSEDGSLASFAGQFESYLDLKSYEEIKSAIVQCIEAAETGRVQSYSENMLTESDLRISVIIQNMVDAQFAGVVFSVNPVNHRRDMIVVNAVAGKGEALVSGMLDAAHYEVFRSGSNIRKEIEKNKHFISEEHLREILNGVLSAEANAGTAVDMEWAIDHKGKLHWLQVRPVTTLDTVHYNELDTVKGTSTDVWTLGNIGEMMPGVATPLTYSVSAEAIDYGMTALAASCGVFNMKNRKAPQYIQMFYNRLFINMTHMMDYPKNIWLNKAEDVQFAICGKSIPGLTNQSTTYLPKQIYNFARQIMHSAKAARHLKKLMCLANAYHIEAGTDMHELYRNLSNAQFDLGVGFELHLSTSAQSGGLYSAFMRIMIGSERRPEAADHHTATMLLLNIPEIESADAVKSLEAFAELIHEDTNFSERFINAPLDHALMMLQTDAPANILDHYKSFIERHGHRCVRESELREKTWEEDPLQIVQILQTRVRVGACRSQQSLPESGTAALPANLSWLKKRILMSLITTARKAVSRREASKAYSIKMVNTVRKRYRLLATQMKDAALLDDTDQIYFLTHEEIGQLLETADSKWKRIANRRRELLPEMDAMVFDEVCFGIPEPLQEELPFVLSEGQLKGTPVSSGIVEGRVRIVNSLTQAASLQQGEIMVASFTDIGWTPYFSIIAGLITEIGSPLSHGAVVAREYGIPAIVGAKGAKTFLKDGDLIVLNGKSGIIEKK